MYLYIFEDKENSALSQLFIMGFPKSVSDTFLFANSNNNIRVKLEEMIENNTIQEYEHIFIFFDFPADNREVMNTFTKLVSMCKEKLLNKVTIIPIPCAEYYFIKSIENTNLNINKNVVEMAIDRVSYKKFQSKGTRISNSSHEKFCKGIVDYVLLSCASGKS